MKTKIVYPDLRSVINLKEIPKVDPMAAVYTFYALEHIYIKFLTYPSTPRYYRLLEEIEYVKEEYDSSFARALRDYFLLASCGEARYAWEKSTHASPLFIKTKARSKIFSYIIKYDPKYLVNILEELFSKKWKMEYGGEPWLRIIQTVKRYLTIPDPPFIDSCVNLVHHGGIAFDKGIIFKVPKNKEIYEEWEEYFQDMLDMKRKAKDFTEVPCYSYFTFLEKYNNNLMKEDQLILDLGPERYKGFPEIPWGKLRPQGITVVELAELEPEDYPTGIAAEIASLLEEDDKD
jgi:hypothetical protein